MQESELANTNRENAPKITRHIFFLESTISWECQVNLPRTRIHTVHPEFAPLEAAAAEFVHPIAHHHSSKHKIHHKSRSTTPP